VRTNGTGRPPARFDPRERLVIVSYFGDVSPLDTQRAILRRAFDLGVTQCGLANN